MRKLTWITNIMFFSATIHSLGQDLVIQSFDKSGQITFNVVTNASRYRVEWASAAGGPWTNFTAAASLLDDILPTEVGVMTASVPMLYRVVATVTTAPPAGMVAVPAGNYYMGNATNIFPMEEGLTNELPQHLVYISGFYMDQYEVTKSLWDDVASWASQNSYDLGTGDASAKANNHPVVYVSWYEAVKWCNARSERESLEPCYYRDSAHSILYKSGSGFDYSNSWVNWKANGYRLPTEAEWEKAARGGIPFTRFPWADYTNNISHEKANYRTSYISYDISYDYDGGDYHPSFATGNWPFTSPAGYFDPNGYGIYDMAGNVEEWCWDSVMMNYSDSPANNPLGPDDRYYRVFRGGSWYSSADSLRCAYRGEFFFNPQGQASPTTGFRCVRRQDY